MVKSAYIHIPFCMSICAYCDFCKMYYIKKWITPYLVALQKEIQLFYKGEVLDTIYIGGGTPSVLSLEELEQLFQILSEFRMSDHLEYTIECNPDSLNKEKLQLFKKYGINRLSIGVETLQPRLQKKIGRIHTKEEIKALLLEARKLGFQNINLDLMYALPSETMEELQEDLTAFLSFDVPHISTYSLMIEPHTKFGNEQIKPIDEDMDALMYQTIKDELQIHEYLHYETSNFGKKGYFSNHNLAYWKNAEYYGFGLGASGYINHVRYENTKSIQKYLQGEYRLEEHHLTELETMQNEIILGLRKMEGVRKKDFVLKYGKEIKQVFAIEKLLATGKLVETEEFYYIPEEYQYLANEVLIYFI